MAYAEMKVLLGRLVWAFEMKIEEGNTLGEGAKGLGRGRERKGEFQVWDWFAGRVQGPVVRFRRRDHDRAEGNGKGEARNQG